jgi:hypothetical protein
VRTRSFGNCSRATTSTPALKYHGEFGVEAQIFKNAELLVGYRHQTRALAVQWAEQERQDIEKGGT